MNKNKTQTEAITFMLVFSIFFLTVFYCGMFLKIEKDKKGENTLQNILKPLYHLTRVSSTKTIRKSCSQKYNANPCL